jgi:hypothetical protein
LRTAPIPPKISREIQLRITEAKDLLTAAERELETALNALAVEERSDKRMISQRLEIAFEKLAAGRRNLEIVLQDDS